MRLHHVVRPCGGNRCCDQLRGGRLGRCRRWWRNYRRLETLSPDLVVKNETSCGAGDEATEADPGGKCVMGNPLNKSPMQAFLSCCIKLAGRNRDRLTRDHRFECGFKMRVRCP